MTSEFDKENAHDTYRRIPEFRELEELMPDALDMLSSLEGEQAAIASGDPRAVEDYWNNIGKGKNGFYDDIRENGCFSCGSHYPGNCDGCA